MSYFILEKRVKRHPENPNSLRCDIVTSFYIVMTSREDVWLFVFYLFHGLILVCEITRIHHWSSVGTGKSKSVGPAFQWEMRLAENGGPEG